MRATHHTTWSDPASYFLVVLPCYFLGTQAEHYNDGRCKAGISLAVCRPLLGVKVLFRVSVGVLVGARSARVLRAHGDTWTQNFAELHVRANTATSQNKKEDEIMCRTAKSVIKGDV